MGDCFCGGGIELQDWVLGALPLVDAMGRRLGEIFKVSILGFQCGNVEAVEEGEEAIVELLDVGTFFLCGRDGGDKHC